MIFRGGREVVVVVVVVVSCFSRSFRPAMSPPWVLPLPQARKM